MRGPSPLLVALAATLPFGCATSPAGKPQPTAAQLLADPAFQQANHCGAPAVAAIAAGKPMPLVEGLAPVGFKVAASPAAARYFEQGMALLYGFEYPLARRSFAAARALDPACAMCAWGEALALGPYVNSGPGDLGDIAAARALVATALAKPGLPDRDRALLAALAVRYAPKPPADQDNVHAEDYADAMLAVAKRWPADDVLQILGASAAMEAHPWHYYADDRATPLPRGQQALDLVETVLQRHPDQAQAIHLYIHLTELSSTPERAEKYADRLGQIAPNSAHLVHMPAHTYYLVGRYRDSIAVNERAVGVDEGMARRIGDDPKFFGYFFHHTRFILSSAEQIGDAPVALKAAAELEAAVTGAKTKSRSTSPMRAQGTLAMALQTRAQFGSVADVLAIPRPDATRPLVLPFWYAARAEARARGGDVAGARRELAALHAVPRAKADKDLKTLIGITASLAEGRVALAAGQPKAAMAAFRRAAAFEAMFDYDEPPLVHQPVAVAMGRALLAAGDAAGAKASFARALVQRPGNGWALWGEAQAEAKLGDTRGHDATLATLDRVWAGDRALLTMDRL